MENPTNTPAGIDPPDRSNSVEAGRGDAVETMRATTRTSGTLMTDTNDPELPFGQEMSFVQMDEEPINRSGGENPEGDDYQGVPPGRGKAKKPYKGGRQTQGGIPNPDDVDDKNSPGSFRGLDNK